MKDNQENISSNYKSLSYRNFFNHIRNNKDSQFLLIQLSINFSFMFVELIYGFLSNSLGLISDSVHMLIDSSALALGLYASFVARLQPNSTFTFGYERVEVMSGFVNGIFLLFVVVEIMQESFARVLNPQKVIPEKMILVSTLGLAINLLGLYFFHEHSHIHAEEDFTDDNILIDHDYHELSCSNQDRNQVRIEDNDHIHHKKHQNDDSLQDDNHIHKHQIINNKHDHHHDHHHDHNNDHNNDHHHEINIDMQKIGSKQENHSYQVEQDKHTHHHHHHDNHNLAGVYLHILADALGSVACIISAIIIYFYDFYLADPITSILMSILILYTTIQLLKRTAKVLLFQVPPSGQKIDKTLRQNFSNLNQIISYDLKLWHFAGKKMVILGRFKINKKDEVILHPQILSIMLSHTEHQFQAIDYEYVI